MKQHYILPEGNVLISVSGGRTSGYMLHQILEANGGLPDRVIVSFQNTGREMPATLDFVQEISDRWSVPIIWLEFRPTKPLFKVVSHNSASRNGEPFSALIKKRQMLPNIAMRFCTQEMKVMASRRYLIKHMGWNLWHNARGIRADESHRATVGKDKRIINWHPLNDAGATKRDAHDFWESQPFGLRLHDVDGVNPFGNCDGCFLKSEASKSLLFRLHPERGAWWENEENLRGATFRDRQPMCETRAMVERQGDWIFDDEDFLCQVDGGECTG